VAPAAHQGGPLKRSPQAGSVSLEGTRLPRAGSASLEGTRLPRAGSTSLEGAPHAHARPRTRVRAFSALVTAGRHHHAPGTRAPVLLHQLPRGNPSPPLWGTVRHGRCQPRDAAPPTPVRLTRRALEGGPATPSICFPVTSQGQVKTLGQRGAIPATINYRRPPPRVQHHAGHCGNSSGAVRRAGTGRHHACHCIPYGSSSATPSNPPEDITANHSYPRSHHCSGTRYAMMAKSRQGPSRRPPTLPRGAPYLPM
jgi:hypothetical protein